MTAVAFSSRMQWSNPDGTLSREAVTLIQALLNRTGGAVAAGTAAIDVSFNPTGGLSSTNVQAMGAELDAEKVPLTRQVNGHALTGDVTLSASDVGAQPHTANLDTWNGKTAPIGTVVGDADGQTLTNKQIDHPVGTMTLRTGVLGYEAGNGGVVTQATSKTTGVTLNKMSGDITLNAAALAAGAAVSFTLTNSNISATDLVIAEHNSAGTNGAYLVVAQVLTGGACVVSVRNLTGGSLSEAIVIRFVVFKAATS